MNKNIKIAKQLVKLAKELIGVNQFENMHDDRIDKVLSLPVKQFCDALQLMLKTKRDMDIKNEALANTVQKLKSSFKTGHVIDVSGLSERSFYTLQMFEQGGISQEAQKYYRSLLTDMKRLSSSKQLDPMALMWRLNRLVQQSQQHNFLIHQDEVLFQSVLDLLKKNQMVLRLGLSKQQGDKSTEDLMIFKKVQHLIDDTKAARIRVLSFLKDMNVINKNVKILITDLTNTGDELRDKYLTLVHAYSIVSSMDRDAMNKTHREAVMKQLMQAKTALQKEIADQKAIGKENIERKNLLKQIDRLINITKVDIPTPLPADVQKDVTKYLCQVYGIDYQQLMSNNEQFKEITGSVKTASFFGNIYNFFTDKIKRIYNSVVGVVDTIKEYLSEIYASISSVEQVYNEEENQRKAQLIRTQMKRIKEQLESLGLKTASKKK